MLNGRGTGGYGDALSKAGRIVLYVCFLAIWTLLWGPASVVAFRQDEMLKTVVGPIILLLPAAVYLVVWAARRDYGPFSGSRSAT